MITSLIVMGLIDFGKLDNGIEQAATCFLSNLRFIAKVVIRHGKT